MCTGCPRVVEKATLHKFDSLRVQQACTRISRIEMLRRDLSKKRTEVGKQTDQTTKKVKKKKKKKKTDNTLVDVECSTSMSLCIVCEKLEEKKEKGSVVEVQ